MDEKVEMVQEFKQNHGLKYINMQKYLKMPIKEIEIKLLKMGVNKKILNAIIKI